MLWYYSHMYIRRYKFYRFVNAVSILLIILASVSHINYTNIAEGSVTANIANFSNFSQATSPGIYGTSAITAYDVYNYQDLNGFGRDLRIGDSGPDVLFLQQNLNKLLPDFYKKYITGQYDIPTYIGMAKFQKKSGLTITGSFSSSTRAYLNNFYFQKLCPPGSGNFNNMVFPNELLLQVNQTTSLPANYIPSGLVNLLGQVQTTNLVCLKQEVVPYLQSMMRDASNAGISLAVTSGFRSPQTQTVLFDLLSKFTGDQTGEWVADPLHSEHQLGTAIDFTYLASSSNPNFKMSTGTNSVGSVGPISPASSVSTASTGFEGTPGDLWLRANAYKYGFVQSYPNGKTKITGYMYEPWHYRYVGMDIASKIRDRGITLEEYFDTLGN
jgi:LAS superfamily LD-carboxypeptidase LdcB